jgi:hypothetical protein
VSRPKSYSNAPFMVAAFLLASLQLILGRAKILGETFTNNDDLMRATQVRDLLNGQAWWDLHQYRLGVGPELAMHWTRHVDALVLAIVLPLRPFVGDELALKVAGIVLPILLAVVMLYLISRIARLVAGEEAVIPSLFFAVASLWTLSQFSVGRIDHHGLQIVLAFVMILGVLRLENWKSALLAAAGAGVALSVGLEAVGVVAGVMIAAGLIFVRVGRPARTGTAVFFIGTPMIALASSLLFAPPARILGTACDVLSRSVLIPLFIVGVGVVGAVWRASESFARRLAALAAAASAGLVWLVLSTPQCLAGPYADVEPWFVANWINGIQEAQNNAQSLERNPFWAIGWLIPVIASFIVLAKPLKNEPRTHLWRLMPILGTTFAVALTQIRGVPIVVSLTPPILAVILGRVSARFESLLPALRGLLLAGVVLVLTGVLLPFIGAAAGYGLSEDLVDCGQLPATDLDRFADNARILSPLDMGPDFLFHYPEIKVIGAPYHRNNEGNLIALRTLDKEVTEGVRILDDNEIDVVLVCNAGPTPLSGSLLDALMRGDKATGFSQIPIEGDHLLLFVRESA